jgi:peptide chain release factor 2
LPGAYNSSFADFASPPWKQNASTPSPTTSPTSKVAAINSGGIFDFDAKSEKLIELNRVMEDPGIWNDAERAQALGKEKKSLEAVVLTLEGVKNTLADARELFEMAKEEDDEDTMIAVEADLAGVEAKVADLEFRRMFANPADPNNCFIDIQAGAGGTEACDWASMLLRQYLKYCERKGFKTEILEQTDGDVAGIRSASLKVEGDYAYGFLRTETGVHRLVRKSPFDSSGGRHTSFASLYVYPEIDDSIEVEINPADLRIDTFRASGAGGQHINKTDSAIRITHAPTGIVVQCQNDRSQHRNKAEAMAMLKSRLYELELRKRQAEADKLESAKTDVGWGHQIRSYVLDQSRIKDLRTNVEISNTQKVLDGDLDTFIEASLKQGV